MRKTFLKLPLTLLACPLLAVMAISGHALGTKEADHQKLTVVQAREQSEKQVGRLWLIAMPHLSPEEKEIVTQYFQKGIQRDYDKNLQDEIARWETIHKDVWRGDFTGARAGHK